MMLQKTRMIKASHCYNVIRTLIFSVNVSSLESRFCVFMCRDLDQWWTHLSIGCLCSSCSRSLVFTVCLNFKYADKVLCYGSQIQDSWTASLWFIPTASGSFSLILCLVSWSNIQRYSFFECRYILTLLNKKFKSIII